MVWILMWSRRQAIALAVIVSCLIFWTADPLLAQTVRQLSDESLELGKKWMALARAAAGARLAADDMRTALQHMEVDHSDAAWNILEAKKGIALSAISNLGDLACAGLSLVWEKVCSLGKETANTWNAAWHCGEGSYEQCAGMTTSYLKVAAQTYTKNGHRVVDGLTALDGVRRGELGLDQLVAACDAVDFSICPVVALVKNAREAQEVRALKGQLDTIFANNLRIGNAALQRAEQRVREIERQASEAYAAYRTQRGKDEAIKAEKDKREQEEMAQAKRDQEEWERVKRQQAETEQARNSASMPSQDSVAQRQGRGGSNKQNEQGGVESPIKPSPDGGSQIPVSGGKSFDVTAWNYGDPVPGVERPPEFDKPRKKTLCRLKDTSCLDPLEDGATVQPEGEKQVSPNKLSPNISHEQIRQEIERKIKGGLLSSEKIRQDIEKFVRSGWRDPSSEEGYGQSPENQRNARSGWHDPILGEGYSQSPEDQMLASTYPSYGSPTELRDSSPDQPSRHVQHSRNDRSHQERYLVRCEGVFNDLQTRMESATNMSLQVAASEGIGDVSGQIKQMMSQLPRGNGGGELIKQMVVMAGSEDRAIALTRQSIGDWRRYLEDLRHHQAKDYAISQQKYQTLVVLGDEGVKVSEATLEALECYRMNK